MPVTHTKRNGLTYYLCKTVTHSSKPSYVVTRELRGQSVEHLPGAYTIREGNGVVSLVKRIPDKMNVQSTDCDSD